MFVCVISSWWVRGGVFLILKGNVMGKGGEIGGGFNYGNMVFFVTQILGPDDPK